MIFQRMCPVYAAEGLLVVHEAKVGARVPFNYLLNDIPEYKDLFCCAPSLAKAGLFPSQLSICPSNNPLNQNSSQQLGYNGHKGDTSPVPTTCKIPFLG